MNIIFLTQYLPSPSQPGGSRPWMMSKYFGSRGHDVKVITSEADYLTGMSLKNSLGQDELPATVDVLRVKTIQLGKDLFSRLLQYITFLVFAFLKAINIKEADIVLATSPPIFVGLLAYFIAKFKKSKFVFEVRDPWPDAIVHFNVLRNKYIIKVLYQLEYFLYREADLIIVISPGIKTLLQTKGISADKIKVITNAYDLEIFEAVQRDFPSEIASTRKITNVLYAGSLGEINELPALLTTAEILKDHSDIKFSFIGSGKMEKELKDLILSKNLANVTVLDPVPRKEIPRVMFAADIGILAAPPGLYSEIGLYNKLFDYLGAGLPVVAAARGDMEELLTTSGAGIVVAPRDSEAMAQAIVLLAQNPLKAREIGEKGRNYLALYYQREKILSNYLEILEDLAAAAAKKKVNL